MEPGKKFIEYAIAFEQTFSDDNWERLEPFFAEDAIYTVTGGPPFGGRFDGREQLLEQLRSSVNDFDRKFEVRRVERAGPFRIAFARVADAAGEGGSGK